MKDSDQQKFLEALKKEAFRVDRPGEKVTVEDFYNSLYKTFNEYENLIKDYKFKLRIVTIGFLSMVFLFLLNIGIKAFS